MDLESITNTVDEIFYKGIIRFNTYTPATKTALLYGSLATFILGVDYISELIFR